VIYAVTENEKVLPSPGARASCPACMSEVLAKCGGIYAWHWAHKSAEDCDAWAEPETEWHRHMKEQVIDRGGRVEVPFDRHRADAVIGKAVIEFQHSPLSQEQISEREAFYRYHGLWFLWVLDGSAFADRFRYQERNDGQDWRPRRFWWSHGRPCWLAAQRPIMVDLGGESFWINDLQPGEAATDDHAGKSMHGEGFRILPGMMFSRIVRFGYHGPE
jgi:hypothetical protein